MVSVFYLLWKRKKEWGYYKMNNNINNNQNNKIINILKSFIGDYIEDNPDIINDILVYSKINHINILKLDDNDLIDLIEICSR